MEALLAAIVLAWLFMRGAEAVRKEWAHTRDRYRKQLQLDHPGWSPGRVNRNARHRARGWWWNEMASGFPTFKASWAEHRLLAEVERAEAAASGETRVRDLRKRLAAALEKREAVKAGADTGSPAPALVPEPPEPPALPAAEPEAEPAPGCAPEPAAVPGAPEPEAEPWTTDPAPSEWLRPGEPPCGGCQGEGRNTDGTDACPACRGFGSAAPDPSSPLAPAGTVCAACGHPAAPGDPVLAAPGAPVHRSHAIDQHAAYTEALARMRGTATEPATGGDIVTTTTAIPDLEGAETPFEGLQAVLGAHARNARAAATHAQDDVIAYAVTHGFDRDPAVMSALQACADAAEASATAAETANRDLAARHADGAEYHATGTDAHASAFRPA